jgi:hypothetical protein
MDYYNNKYERICIEKSTDDSIDKAVDIVIKKASKKGKIYRVTNYTYRIDVEELSEIIDKYVIEQNFILQSVSKTNNEIILYQQHSDSYLIINPGTDSNGKFYNFELVIPVQISTIN